MIQNKLSAYTNPPDWPQQIQQYYKIEDTASKTIYRSRSGSITIYTISQDEVKVRYDIQIWKGKAVCDSTTVDIDDVLNFTNELISEINNYRVNLVEGDEVQRPIDVLSIGMADSE